MKLEKRDVYIREFWDMSYIDRYIYAVLNTYCRIQAREMNPLKWSIEELIMMVGTALVIVVTPFASVFAAFHLRNTPMPESKDPMFQGYQDWREKDKWVVKR